MTLLLIVSTVIALLAGKIPTAIAIGIIVAVNIPLGFMMEYKAEKELEALKNMLKSNARIIRNGKEQLIDFTLIVPGDIVIIEEGQKIPADARLIEENNLRVNEASLTGESVPVEKDVIEIKGKENSNLVFLGTTAMTGYAKAVVVSTGRNTEFGKIAQSLAEIKKPLTPLQKQVNDLGKGISFVGVLLAIFTLILMEVKGLPFWQEEQLKMALSIFVTIIPAGLLVVMTLTLAIGVKNMAKEKVIVKKLSSVETLGSTQVICTDKTGTLTENKMKVKKVWVNNQFFVIGEKIELKKKSDLEALIKAGVLCNSADVSENEDGSWESLGDPTESSLLILGEKAGIKEKILKNKGRLFDFPFDQRLRRRMTVFENLEEKEEKASLISIGAPENILEVSSYYLSNGTEKRISNKDKVIIEKTFLDLAAQGYRVIGLASKKIKKTKNYDEQLKEEREFTFIGFTALYDPPRPEIKEAINECKEAGIKIVMVTGDNELTAVAIAKEIGMIENNDEKSNRVITGAQIEKMNDDELLRTVTNYDVFARTAPLHKLRTVKAFQKLGKVVAVTGDGVNDAPALKEADIGAAMGIRGTDVSKEASEIIITDDNFGSIAKAVKRGRITYANIKKFIQFLLTANAIELPLIFTAIIIGIPMPITALQILWINFVTDSMPALTLGLEPGTKDIMHKKPRPPKEHILKGTISFILFASFLGFIFSLLIFLYLYFYAEKSLIFAQTMTFTFIVIYKLFLVFSARANTKT
ncbi:MAG: cation-transporting P-type ATPase, partial [Candidatus Pacebacteria bacterium]|nr:cation-transporting P-type ATPase [Candidatus Paceibacterota bacterium]